MHLREHMHTPMADVRYWLRSSSRVVRQLRASWMVQWIDTDVVRLRNQMEIDKIKLQHYIHAKIAELQKFVNEKVLFGISLEKLGIKFDFSTNCDTGDEETYGYSPLCSVNNDGTLNNEDSDKFFDAVVEAGVLGVQVLENGEVTWDKGASLEWTSNIDTAWTKLVPLDHVTSGGPGRGTEKALFQSTNTKESRRHLFYKDNTIGFASNYHKGHLSTGIYKFILRLLPYDLAVILAILIRIVRPIELAPLLEFHIRPEDQEKTLEVYRTRVYASWGEAWDSGMLSASLMAFFKEGFGYNMGIQAYRHLAIAFGQRYLDYHKEVNTLARALSDQAGHTVDMEARIYAGKKNSTQNLPTDENHFIRVSRDWHQMFGVRTHKLDSD
jgi:hypothetical protein